MSARPGTITNPCTAAIIVARHKLRRRFIALTTSILGKLEPHAAIALRIVPPIFAHLDEKEQVDRRLCDRGNLAPRAGADRLDGCPTLPQHDLALAFALDVDRLLDAYR